MKQLEVTSKNISGNQFYIKPFPAFVAANISGDLAAVLAPMLGSLAPMVGDIGSSGNVPDLSNGLNIGDIDISNIEVEKALPLMTSAFSTLSGDKFERLMKKLLIDNQNISVEGEATDGNVQILTSDLANEVFCGDVQDMFILCWEVIKINFKGFFKKLGTRFGSLRAATPSQAPNSTNTGN